MTEPSSSELVASVSRGDQRAVGRAITRALDGDESLRSELDSKLGRAHRIGVTGPPGVGKSTLIAALARTIVRKRNERVGVVASDPSSPRSGGAFLGDRVRLAGFRVAEEESIFFRSLAAVEDGQGSEARARLAADVLDAAGYPWILVETVGAGQMDLAIRDHVHTTLVVLSPDLGDEMQLLKAGLLEIADVFAITRCDRPGAERFRALLEERTRFRGDAGGSGNTVKTPAIFMIDSFRGEGVDALCDWLARARRESP